ncbi:MAG: HTH domain-containing protein [Saprospiraceae bacterium]|nr:HTH domain-containing protein [Saprospiraceae bacterium]
MSCFTEKFRKLERLDALIRRWGTGSPDELAERLNVSVRTMHNYIIDHR